MCGCLHWSASVCLCTHTSAALLLELWAVGWCSLGSPWQWLCLDVAHLLVCPEMADIPPAVTLAVSFYLSVAAGLVVGWFVACSVFSPLTAYLRLQIILWIFHPTRVQWKASWMQKKSPADFNGTLIISQITDATGFIMKFSPLLKILHIWEQFPANYILLEMFLLPYWGAS